MKALLHNLSELIEEKRESVKRFINHRYTDFTVIFLIIFSIFILVAEHVYEMHYPHGRMLRVFDTLNGAITVLFCIELFLRWFALGNTPQFLKEYWIDILAVASMFRSFRILRILRLLRMFRVGKLLNRRFSSVQVILHRSILQHFWLIIILVTLVLAGAISIQLAESSAQRHISFDDAIWWSIFTLIGGEPIWGNSISTLSGKIIAIFVMVSGLITFAAFTGLIAAIMVNKLKPEMKLGDIELDHLSDHIVICGWNRALKLIIQVFQSSEEYRDLPIVLIAEYKEDEPFPALIDLETEKKRIDPSNIYVVKGDYTRTDVLKRANIERAKQAIILADKTKPRSDQDRDARTILASMMIEKLNPDIFTCVELLNRENAKYLEVSGVEEVLISDDYAGPILANAQRTRGLIQMLDELFNPAEGNQFYRIDIPSKWIGKTVEEVMFTLKFQFDAILIALESPKLTPHFDKSTKTDRSIFGYNKRSEWNVKVNPPLSEKLKEGDKMIVIARKRPNFSKIK